jgi:hypothetical protein
MRNISSTVSFLIISFIAEAEYLKQRKSYPTIGHDPEPVSSTSYPHDLFPWDPAWCYPTIYFSVSYVAKNLLPEPYAHSLSTPSSYMFNPH